MPKGKGYTQGHHVTPKGLASGIKEDAKKKKKTKAGSYNKKARKDYEKMLEDAAK
jgi:F0F1-type ATP synthase membrane subunit b/b'